MRNRRVPAVSGVPVLSSGFPILSSIQADRTRGSVAGQVLPGVHSERWNSGGATDDVGQPGQGLHDSLLTGFIGRSEELQDLDVDLEAPASAALDPKDAHIDEAPDHGPTLAQRADPQFFPKHRAQLSGGSFPRPVLLDLDGERRKPRLGPAVLEIDRPCSIRQVVDIDDSHRIVHLQQPEDIDSEGAQLDRVERNHRRARLSPCRTVTNVRSRYSRIGTTTRRLLPSTCRISLTVDGPCSATKALTCVVA